MLRFALKDLAYVVLKMLRIINPIKRYKSMKLSVKLSIVFSIILVSAVVIVKSLSSGELKQTKGKVISVSKGGVNDAVFKIDNDQRTFYINRGFENINEKTLMSLVGTNAVFYFHDSWTPLDPFNQGSKHIVRLENNQHIIFYQYNPI